MSPLEAAAEGRRGRKRHSKQKESGMISGFDDGRAPSPEMWQPQEAENDSQLTVSEKTGTSVLQPQGTEFGQQPR